MKLNSICALVIFAAAIVASCSAPLQPENLNGYWEIESVTLDYGTEKEYNINTIVDFIQIDGDSGTRTKVKPQLDGTFINSGATEAFTISTVDKFSINYKTPYANWTEELLFLNEQKMRVKNKDGKVFTYKKFIPFTLKTK